MTLEREFKYNERNFHFLKEFAKKMTGVTLEDTKQEMVFSRISRLLRKHKIDSFDEYCSKLEVKDSPLLVEFVNAITTHLTYFMREQHHFDFLRETILPNLINNDAQRIRLWSAGCSTGEEAYGIAFICSELLADHPGCDCKILATDVDQMAVERGAKGCYPKESLQQASQQELQKYFNEKENYYSIKSNIKSFIHFKTHNLMQPNWPMSGPFDVIFCRNVLIYFDRETQLQLINKFASLLSPKGYLILGHSESIMNSAEQLQFLGKTIYQRK